MMTVNGHLDGNDPTMVGFRQEVVVSGVPSSSLSMISPPGTSHDHGER
jgi:hypothetical protein